MKRKVNVDILVTGYDTEDYNNPINELEDEISELDEEIIKVEVPKKTAIEIMDIYNRGKT